MQMSFRSFRFIGIILRFLTSRVPEVAAPCTRMWNLELSAFEGKWTSSSGRVEVRPDGALTEEGGAWLLPGYWESSVDRLDLVIKMWSGSVAGENKYERRELTGGITKVGLIYIYSCLDAQL